MKPGAERREGKKESGDRPLKFPRSSNFFSSCLSWLRWRLILMRCRLMESRYSQYRKRYCDKGFHKLTRGKISVHYKKQSSAVEYLACVFCEYKFFSTVEDKRIYLKIKKKTHWPLPGKEFKALLKRKKERIDNAKRSK